MKITKLSFFPFCATSVIVVFTANLLFLSCFDNLSQENVDSSSALGKYSCHHSRRMNKGTVRHKGEQIPSKNDGVSVDMQEVASQHHKELDNWLLWTHAFPLIRLFHSFTKMIFPIVTIEALSFPHSWNTAKVSAFSTFMGKSLGGQEASWLRTTFILIRLVCQQRLPREKLLRKPEKDSKRGEIGCYEVFWYKTPHVPHK